VTLTGLPPMLVLVGTNDALLDDSTRLADRDWHTQRRCVQSRTAHPL